MPITDFEGLRDVVSSKADHLATLSGEEKKAHLDMASKGPFEVSHKGVSFEEPHFLHGSSA